MSDSSGGGRGDEPWRVRTNDIEPNTRGELEDALDAAQAQVEKWKVLYGTVGASLLERAEKAEARVANYERYVEREIEPKLLERAERWRDALERIGAQNAPWNSWARDLARAALTEPA